jgi:hypothetical protein
MAVEDIFMIASRWFNIFGSGTCSTRMSFLPYQQLALITFPFSELTGIDESCARASDARDCVPLPTG